MRIWPADVVITVQHLLSDWKRQHVSLKMLKMLKCVRPASSKGLRGELQDQEGMHGAIITWLCDLFVLTWQAFYVQICLVLYAARLAYAINCMVPWIFFYKNLACYYLVLRRNSPHLLPNLLHVIITKWSWVISGEIEALHENMDMGTDSKNGTNIFLNLIITALHGS